MVEIEAVLKLFEVMNDAVLVLGKDSVIEYANNVACILFSKTKSELQGLPCNKVYRTEGNIWEKIIELDDQQTGTPLVEKYITNHLVEIEVKHSILKTSKGSKVIQVIRSYPIKDQKKTGIGKKTLLSLDKITSTLNTLTLPAVVTGNNGNIYYVNGTWEKTTGYKIVEVLNTKIQTILYKNLFQGEYQNITINEKVESFDNETFSVKMKNGQREVFTIHTSAPEGKNSLYILLFISTSEKEETRKEIRHREIEQQLRHINQALKISQRNYRRLFDEMVSGFAVHRMIYNDKDEPIDYQFLEVNPAFEKLTGLKAEYIINKTVKEILPDIEDTWIMKYGKVAKTGKPIIFQQYSGPLKKHYEVTAYSPEKDFFATIFTDITSMVEASTKLTQSEKRYRELVEKIPDIILRVDSDFRCIYVSPHVYELAAVRAEDFIGKRLSETDLKIDFTENREKEFAGVFRNRSSYQTVLNVNTAQNRKILEWRMIPEFDEHGEVLSILNIIRDITELRKTENELNQIFNLSADLICIIDTDGRFQKINPAFESILGHTEQEILSTRLFDLVHPDDVKSTIKALQGKKTSRDTVINFENRIRCKDNSFKWISWVTQKLGDEGLVYAIARNITEQRKAIIELVSAKEKAEEGDRLKSAFLANMSHEIRTPMNAIVGFAMLLQRRGISQKKISHYTNIIRHRSEDLLQIINDILDISKIELGQINIAQEEISVNAVFNELYEEFSQKHKEKIKDAITFSIEKYAKGRHQKISNDLLRFKQVLTNLIDNALKFTTEGYVKFGCQPDKGKMIFYVADSGIGIPMHKQKDVFERFRQADESITRQFGGNGLGLAISKALVELMGGTIWLESKESVGTAFYFSLPLEKVRVKKVDEVKTTKTNSNNLSGKRILVIEDDPLSIEFFRIVLENARAEVTFASSGGEALIIYESDPAFDLILMDVRLPDISGYEVTRRIRKDNKKIPIVAQTAFAMAEDRAKSLEAGCNEYLTKPILSDELLEALANQLQKTASY